MSRSVLKGLSLAFRLLSTSAGRGSQERDTDAVDVDASRWPGMQGEVSHRGGSARSRARCGRRDEPRGRSPAFDVFHGRGRHLDLVPLASSGRRRAARRSDGGLRLTRAGSPRGDPRWARQPRARNRAPRTPTTAVRTWSAPLRISKATKRDDKVALAVDDGPDSPFRDRVHVAWKWPSGGIFYSSSDDRGIHFARPRL